MQLERNEYENLRKLLERFENTTRKSADQLQEDLKDTKHLHKEMLNLDKKTLKERKLTQQDVDTALNEIEFQQTQLNSCLLNAQTTNKGFKRLIEILNSLVPKEWVESGKKEQKDGEQFKKEVENSST